MEEVRKQFWDNRKLTRGKFVAEQELEESEAHDEVREEDSAE